MFTDAIQFAGWLIQFSEMKIKKKKELEELCIFNNSNAQYRNA